MDMDPEVRRKQLEKIFKWGFALIGAVVISPFVFLAVKGIIGLALAVITGMVIINFAPVFSTWLANKRIEMLVKVVEANPIETMQNLYAEKTTELESADHNIVDFETEIGNFDDQMDGFRKDYPKEVGTYEALSDKMHEGLGEMKTEQTQARQALADFNLKIKKAKAIYKMSLAAQKVTQLSKSAEARVFAQIKEQVAFDTVRTELNKSFASLNLALERRRDTRAALPEARSIPAIDVTSVKTPELVREPRRTLKEVK